MPLEENTIPKRLKKAGYVSGMVGKWHLDPNPTCVKWARKNLPEVKPGKDGHVTIPERSIRQYSALAQGFDECYQGEMHDYFATFDLDGHMLDPHGTMIRAIGLSPGYSDRRRAGVSQTPPRPTIFPLPGVFRPARPVGSHGEISFPLPRQNAPAATLRAGDAFGD